MREKPVRDFCPFSPRPAVLPLPDPGPRPTRFFEWRDVFFGLRLLSSIVFSGRSLLFDHLHEVRDAGDHAARFGRVDARRHPVHLSEAEGTKRLAHVARATDAAADLLDLNHLLGRFFRSGRAHSAPSSTPRSVLYCASLRSCWSASNVALTTLCGLAVPSDLVRMFWIPADSRMARTGPPAMTPVPSEAGLSITLPAP